MRARDVIARLKLQPHPEGGWYRETFRDEAVDGEGRSRSTAILYLLDIGETSEWHRVTDAAETWHWHAGAPLALTLSPNGHDASSHRLGPSILIGEMPQLTVPAGCWQTATSLGEWTLVGCTVAPGFRFESFEMAPKDWRPMPRPARGG
ncbi:cupin [Aureimonas ureilytica]|uniref:Cupin n=1 Tax=Aureimonas ureilytica TaxID=401562 RepID=A0A175RYX1_9HYPH|nr:cupin domain-containing protein [Aureimonas ureilytica]KTR08012.1 cupin [Aureimonas ureilytica]